MKDHRIQKPERQPAPVRPVDADCGRAVIPPLSAARWLLVLIVAAGVYFFHGFLFPVLAALVIAFASWPLYRRLLAGVGGNRTIAATLAILFILAFLVDADRACRHLCHQRGARVGRLGDRDQPARCADAALDRHPAGRSATG